MLQISIQLSKFFASSFQKKTPKLGMEFNTVDEAKRFWTAYGGLIGFDCVTNVRFVCAKEVFRRPNKRDCLTKTSRAKTRTRGAVKYISYEFEGNHNHILQTPETSHMMPSQRSISEVQGMQIDIADDSGIRPKTILELISKQVGGKDVIGFTQQAQKNYLRNKIKRELAYGGSWYLLWYIQNQISNNPYFQYVVQLDSEEQITNIFWADARMNIDYAIFLPLGVFAGFNHHREIVIFGEALLYDETTDSFIWLFETFLATHKQKKPSRIFTDQDLAIYGESFGKDFKACMFDSDDESKFEEAWYILLRKYNVETSTWLEGIYKMKEKWASCYMKDAYSIRMQSTQLSESFNASVKDYVRSSLDIMQIFKHFERAVDGKQYNELEAEYNSRKKLHRLRIEHLPLLKQLILFVAMRLICEYVVGIHDMVGEYKVIGNIKNQTLTCSCKKFETMGILCCHCLKKLPDQYTIKRWRRDARDIVVQDATARASDFEETYLYIDHVADKLHEKIDSYYKLPEDELKTLKENIIESIEQSHSLERVIENVKGLKKKETQKGRKRLRSRVEKQPKRKTNASRSKKGLNKPVKNVEVSKSMACMGPEEHTFNSSNNFQQEKTPASQLSNANSENKCFYAIVVYSLVGYVLALFVLAFAVISNKFNLPNKNVE
ncbi:Protein FAR1-RELATED SEQUENCE 5 [Glycine soja]